MMHDYIIYHDYKIVDSKDSSRNSTVKIIKFFLIHDV